MSPRANATAVDPAQLLEEGLLPHQALAVGVVRTALLAEGTP